VEVYYDGKGKSYFCDRWSRFGMDYGVQQGFFLMFTHHCGMPKFTVCIFDRVMFYRSYAPQA
jgi:hypothetical protein